ncbi:hypothetical protein POF53_16255 [Mitsuaria sp. RG]|nr:hypothetical protein [Mitsuaria sp. RG]
MLNGLKNRITNHCIAIAVAWDVGLKIFHSLIKPYVPSGTFEPLTPVLLEKELFQDYERELLAALNSDEVLNIALTGGYGAGKSSVIKTFFERHPEFKTAYVSLATFSKDAPSPLPVSGAEQTSDPRPENGQTVDPAKESASSGDLIPRIEETIVQQLLYTVPAARLPKTRLKRIVQARKRTIYYRTVAMIALVLGGLRLYVPTIDKLPKIDPDWLVPGLMLIPGWLAVGAVGYVIWYLLHGSMKLLSMLSIDGLTIKGGKLEATNHASVLHKNVDEIIYCFQHSDIRVVVIEDLDRFGTQEVFFRLREINFTIRHSPEIKRPVHFIYAIRDELFTVTDKTKFFDLIIPVIPVVNSENSREKLSEYMGMREVNGSQLGGTLDPVLVETVCYYIDEMRLIKNIVNEYDIFANLLSRGGIELDQNKLFAMVAMRNLHPEEFAELNKRRGRVYSVLTGLSKWMESGSQELLGSRDKLWEERKDRIAAGVEQLIDVRLRVWYEALKAGGLEGANYIQTESGARFSLTAFLQDDTFDQLTKAGQWQSLIVSQHGRVSSGHAFKPVDVLTRASYEKRVARIHTPLKHVEEAIRDVDREIVKTKTISFRDAARGGYGSTITEQLPGLDVIVYLLRNGYLDTDYTDYLGFFYEGSLTRNDQNQLLALRRRALLDVDVSLSNPAKLVDKLDHDSLDGGCGIIASLITELSMTARISDASDIRKQKLEIVLRSGLQHLSRMADATLIVMETETCSKFIQAVHTLQPELFIRLFEVEQFQVIQSRQNLVSALLDGLVPKQLMESDGRSQLLEIIQDLPVVDSLIPKLSNKFSGWAWLRREPVRFKALEEGVGQDTLRRLVEWDCLEFSLPMIKLLCDTLDGTQAGVSYARLRSLDLVGLNIAIECDPHAFIGELLNQEGVIQEDEESLRYLLFLIREESTLQQEYFGRTVCKLGNLEGFSDNIWECALRYDRVVSVASAALQYYDHMIVRPTEKPSESPDVDERQVINQIFADFLIRNAVEAQKLWDDTRDDLDCLQAQIIVSELIDESTLERIFARSSIMAEAIVDAVMTPERWRYLATADFVPFDVEINEAFGNQGLDLELAYLRKRWPEARGSVDLMRQDPYIVGALAKIPEVPIKDICEMWAGVVQRELEGDEAVRDTLGAVCARANREGVTLPRNCLKVIATMAKDVSRPLEERMEMLVQAVELNADWPTLASILNPLGEVYELLSGKKSLVRLPPTALDSRLAHSLSRRGFVGLPKESEKHIEIRSRPSFMV